MEFSIKGGAPEQQATACLIVGVFADKPLFGTAKAADGVSKGQLGALLQRGDMPKRLGESLLLFKPGGLKAERLLVIGLGKQKSFGDTEYRKAVTAAVGKLKELNASNALCYLCETPLPSRDLAWRVRQAVIAAGDALYRFDRLKSRQEDGETALQRIDFGMPAGHLGGAVERALQHGQAILAGQTLAKDLGNLPGNICTPSHLAAQACALAAETGMQAEILERADMEALKMFSLLSVAKGSHEPPKFIILRHQGGGAKEKPVVLIGKGITFDSGGISLKPGAEMDEMKFDMCGGASVLGIMKTAALLKLPLNLIGIVPATENLPGGGASKPGDVVVSMSGQSIEILNTDAEGRLILCDALTYAERFHPACVVDIATLTGACVIALGHIASGLFTNDDGLAEELLAAGQVAGDRAWRMPLWPEYGEQLKSNFADMANIGGRAAGSITAASFLSRFSASYPWAHLDIAGTAWRSGKEKGATGRPVALLAEFLLARSKAMASNTAQRKSA